MGSFYGERTQVEKIVVTRYRTLVTHLKNLGLIDANTKVIAHANPEDIMNKHAFGVLPYWLAAHTAKFTEVQLRIPQEKRGKELTVEEIEWYALDAKTYQIREVRFEDE